MVPMYEKYCASCLKRYPHLKQVSDFWRNYYYTWEAAKELARQEITDTSSAPPDSTTPRSRP
jgi:hypothetical protein